VTSVYSPADNVSAGVIGLQTAVTLLEAGYKVTVVARDWPGDHSPDYTSPWAGAIWRSHASADQVEACKWDLQSYQEWMRIAETNPDIAAEMGIMVSGT
jgi:D-amino-acid oxidase